jgi:hypothetical protein
LQLTRVRRQERLQRPGRLQHALLVIDRGWSADRFERWYADTLTRLLLAEG